MRNFLSSLWRGALLPAFLLGLLFLPSPALAVVGDVTLTGLPPNTTVSLTNEQTKEKVEQKTDERGFVVIPMTGKNWQSGRHSVACRIDGKPVTSRIFLRNGANRIDLTSLTLSARPLDPAKRQKVEEALKQSSAALKADPKNSQALLTQGSALNRLGRHGMALSSLAQAAKFGSTHPALLFETGWSLLRLGMYPQALAQLEKYEKMNPGLGHTSEFLGRSHLYMGQLDKADAYFNEALKRDPNLASTVRFHQAILETLRKNPQAASNHIASLLKEAPNSPTAQIFKNALLQPAGAKPPAGAPGKDYKLSDPIRIQLPPTTAGDVAAGVAKGLVGGLLGGFFGGGRSEPEGPNLVAKPDYPETILTSKDGKTKINLSGALVDGRPNIVMGVKESPGNGAPHLILLQDKNCNVLQPSETSVYEIWEVWGGWRITVSWTKSYYEDGRLVKQEKGGWSTPWHIFRAQVKDPSEIPGIWKDFGGKAFEGIRGVISSFETPPNIPFNPADWNLITHATTDAGNNQILTAPFVTGLGTDQNNNFVFKPMQQTMCESSPPSAPLVAGERPHRRIFREGHLYTRRSPSLFTDDHEFITTFPWTAGPFGVNVTADYKTEKAPDATSGGSDFEWESIVPRLGVTYDIGRTRVKPLPEHFTRLPGDPGPNPFLIPPTTEYLDTPSTIPATPGGARTETRPDGTKIESFPDGTRVETRPDGITIETRPDGTRIQTHPSGARRETRPDGTKVAIRPDGTVTATTTSRPDGTEVITYTSGMKIERFPDGSHVTTYPDGKSVTVSSDGRSEIWSDGTRVEHRDGRTTITRPDGTTIEDTPWGGRVETRPDGSKIYTSIDWEDGTMHTTYPDGTSVETRPDGVRVESRPNGTKRTVFRDGSAVVVGKDGSISFEDPPQTGQPAPQPTDTPAPPSVLDFLDEAIVPS